MRLIKRKEIVNPNIQVDFFSVIFSSGFCTGYAPVASGTVGSAFALLFYFIPGFVNPIVSAITIILCFIAGIFTSNNMVKRYGDDPSVVVIDEFVGMWLTIFIAGFFNFSLLTIIIGFLMFRLFDVIKVYPATFFDKMKNGFGIMFDDVIAGIYAGISTVIVLYVLKYFI